MKTRHSKKDRIFILSIAIIVANLAWFLYKDLYLLLTGGYTNAGAWALLISIIVALIGALWLVRQDKRRRLDEQKSEKAATEKQEFDETNQEL